MDHKDFMDSVISGMTGNNNTQQEPEVPIDPETLANAIDLKLSTGDGYLVDVNTFDWDKAVDSLGQMTENEAAFRNIMHGIMMASHDKSDEAKEYLKNTIKRLEEFLDGYQIQVDYRKFNPDLNDVEIAMMMTFDANNVMRTMIHHTMMYLTLSMAEGCVDGITPGSEDVPDEDRKVYQVCVSFEEDDSTPTIMSVDETDDYPPDEIGVVNDDGQDHYTVLIPASDPEEACKEALQMFDEPDGDAMSDINELLTQEAAIHDMYDAEDEFDNADPDAVIEEDDEDETC